MESKLQELTDKLYAEGLEKGKAAADKCLADAKLETEKTVSQARDEADGILSKAHSDADALASKAASDVKMASQQALSSTKKDIEDLLLHSLVDSKVDKALADEDFVKEIIVQVAKNFTADGSQDLALVLPDKLKGGLEGWVSNELSATLGKGVNASFSKRIQGGFTIGPADGGWFISLTDESFKALISEYLRPVTKKLLFGE